MNHPFLSLLVRWVILALGVTLSTKVLPGIECRDLSTLIVVVLLLSFFNAVLRPVLVLFTLPFIVLTMGLGLVVINALLFMLVSQLVEGFKVANFGWAVGAALIVGATNIIMSKFMRNPPPPRGGGSGGGQSGGDSSQTPFKRVAEKTDDVIDI